MGSTVGSSFGMSLTAVCGPHSGVLNLDIWCMEDDLRFWDPVAGSWLLRRGEERERAEEERSRAEAAESRVAREQEGPSGSRETRRDCRVACSGTGGRNSGYCVASRGACCAAAFTTGYPGALHLNRFLRFVKSIKIP